MEDYKIDIRLSEGPKAQTITMPVEPFTLIGATTRFGMLTPPMRARFGIVQRLNFYPADDLEQIVARTAEVMRSRSTTRARTEIARRARGTPRVANRLLRRVRDYAQVKAQRRDHARRRAATRSRCSTSTSSGSTTWTRASSGRSSRSSTAGPVGLEHDRARRSARTRTRSRRCTSPSSCRTASSSARRADAWRRRWRTATSATPSPRPGGGRAALAPLARTASPDRLTLGGPCGIRLDMRGQPRSARRPSRPPRSSSPPSARRARAHAQGPTDFVIRAESLLARARQRRRADALARAPCEQHQKDPMAWHARGMLAWRMARAEDRIGFMKRVANDTLLAIADSSLSRAVRARARGPALPRGPRPLRPHVELGERPRARERPLRQGARDRAQAQRLARHLVRVGRGRARLVAVVRRPRRPVDLQLHHQEREGPHLHRATRGRSPTSWTTKRSARRRRTGRDRSSISRRASSSRRRSPTIRRTSAPSGT